MQQVLRDMIINVKIKLRKNSSLRFKVQLWNADSLEKSQANQRKMSSAVKFFWWGSMFISRLLQSTVLLNIAHKLCDLQNRTFYVILLTLRCVWHAAVRFCKCNTLCNARHGFRVWMVQAGVAICTRVQSTCKCDLFNPILNDSDRITVHVFLGLWTLNVAVMSLRLILHLPASILMWMGGINLR